MSIKLKLLPVFGICLFTILYIIAASLYPGGSDIDKSSTGFSWLHNYWCELMAKQAQNGQANTARPVAITAMAVLSISLALFWYYASRLFDHKTPGRWIILYPGILSMLVCILLLWGDHDIVMILSGLLGITAMITSLIALYNKRLRFLFSMGILCVLLCMINNYIYYSTNFLNYLPVIQKITFLFFLSWFCGVSIYLSEVGGQKYEVRSRRSEVRSTKSDS